MKEVIDRAIIIISLIIRKVNIILVNPPNDRSIKTLISRIRTKEDNTAIMIGMTLFLLRVIVNTPSVVYTTALNIATKIITIKNINPAIIPAIAPAIA